MAEELKKEQIEEVETDVEETQKKEEKPDNKSIEEKINELMIENARLKKAIDKTSSECADYKKKYRATLSEKEIYDAEKAEKEAQREAEFQALIRENKVNKLEKSYLAMKYTADEAHDMAIAEVDNDVDAKIRIMSQVDTRKKKEYEAEWLKSRPEISYGVGTEKTSVTKEQFNNMGYLERKEFKDKYPNTYKEYTK